VNEEHERIEGLTIPWPLPGIEVGDAQPKTYVKISLEITGAGLPEGGAVRIETQKLWLQFPGDLILDLTGIPMNLQDGMTPTTLDEFGDKQVDLVMRGAAVTDPELPVWTIGLPKTGD
jgi:hypothetical protein